MSTKLPYCELDSLSGFFLDMIPTIKQASLHIIYTKSNKFLIPTGYKNCIKTDKMIGCGAAIECRCTTLIFRLQLQSNI